MSLAKLSSESFSAEDEPLSSSDCNTQIYPLVINLCVKTPTISMIITIELSNNEVNNFSLVVLTFNSILLMMARSNMAKEVTNEVITNEIDPLTRVTSKGLL